jgi:hypothetical protein
MKRLPLATAMMLALSGAALADVTQVRDLRPAMSVTVEGAVERITDDDEFLLADETGQILVYIGPNQMPVRVGDRISVHGRSMMMARWNSMARGSRSATAAWWICRTVTEMCATDHEKAPPERAGLFIVQRV